VPTAGASRGSRKPSDARRSFKHMFDRSAYHPFDRCHGAIKILVFPDPDDVPAGGAEGAVDRPVSFQVPPKLRGPVPVVGRRVAAVLGADVPEAPVNEHGHLAGTEDDVWANPDTAVKLQEKILPEPHAAAVEGTPQCRLRLGVHPPVRPHVPRPPLVQGRRVEALVMGALPQGVAVVVRHGCSQPQTVARSLSSLGQDTRWGLKPTTATAEGSASVA
jgi:hypothetical protein